MSDKSNIEKCFVYIGTELEPKPARPRKRDRIEPSITISRQTGAGGMPIAEHLAEYLQAHGPETPRPWTVFDKNLVEQVLTDHNLPAELARYMPEDKVSQISDMVEELLGLHPASSTLFAQTTETILHLAGLGNVILVGRGANVIAGSLENVFHVRLVGSEEQRVELVQSFYGLSRRAALAFMKKEDLGRRRFLRKYFKKDVDDPLLYHMVINTDWVSFEEATQLIGNAVLAKYY